LAPGNSLRTQIFKAHGLTKFRTDVGYRTACKFARTCEIQVKTGVRCDQLKEDFAGMTARTN